MKRNNILVTLAKIPQLSVTTIQREIQRNCFLSGKTKKSLKVLQLSENNLL